MWGLEWDSYGTDGAGSHPPFKLRSAESWAPSNSEVFLGAVSAGSGLIWILKLILCFHPLAAELDGFNGPGLRTRINGGLGAEAEALCVPREAQLCLPAPNISAVAQVWFQLSCLLWGLSKPLPQ